MTPKGNELVRLGDLCSRITVGHVGPMKDKYQRSGIPFLRSQNVEPFRIGQNNLKFIDDEFHQKLKKSALAPGDVVVVRTGYPGTAALIPASMPVANCADLVVITPGDGINGRYLVAVFNSAWGKGAVAGRLVGVAQQHFNVTIAKELGVPLPPRSTQDKVAAVLAAYDELIENNLRRIEILEEMAQAVYREWFVEFRFPGYEDVEMVESESGPIPDEWAIKNIFDLCEVQYGTTLPSKAMNIDGDHPVYGAAKVIGHHDTYNRESPTVICGCRGTCGVFTLTEPRSFVTNNSFTFDFKDEEKLFFLHALSQRGVDDFIGGSAQPQITLTAIRDLRLVTPDDGTIRSFNEVARPLYGLRANLDRQNVNLRATRDLLLPKLISGDIDVSDLDIDTKWLLA